MHFFISLLLLLLLEGCLTQRIMTTNWGAPVDNIKNSQTVGQNGPVLLQDTWLLERLQTQNRERIPERVVHARGHLAKGRFVLLNNLSQYTTASLFQQVGTSVPIAVRFSTVAHGRDSPEFLRDPRGFALKFYTSDGNWDLVGNTWPVFFIQDGIRFPDLVRAMKPDPVTNLVHWWRRYDFLAQYPASCHALTFLLDDAGIPHDYRHVNGFAINTFRFVNAQGQNTLVRFQWRSQLGEVFINDDNEASQQHFSAQSSDFYDAIARGETVAYDFFVQLLSEDLLFDKEFMSNATFDLTDPTKEWPETLAPRQLVGVLYLDENPVSKFLEDDQAAFSPGRLVKGIEPSDDKLLQARLFSYSDAQRYRLGTNFFLLPINRPKNSYLEQHIDGQMNFLAGGSKSAERINYYPSFEDDVVDAPSFLKDNKVYNGETKVRQAISETADDYDQAGDRYRSFDEGRKDRFAMRVAMTLSEDGVTETILNAWMNIWYQVDPELPDRIGEYMQIFKQPVKSIPDDLYFKWLGFSKTSGSHPPPSRNL